MAGAAGAGVGIGSGLGVVAVVVERGEPADWPPADEKTTLARPSGVATSVPPLCAASRVGFVAAAGRLWKPRARVAEPLAAGGDVFAGSGSAERVLRTGRTCAGERREAGTGARASVADCDAPLRRGTAMGRSTAGEGRSLAAGRPDGGDCLTTGVRATAGARLAALVATRIGSTDDGRRSP
jgi:hypothetical protein